VFKQQLREAVWRNRAFWGVLTAMLVVTLLINGLHIHQRWSRLVEDQSRQAKVLTRTVAEMIALGSSERDEIHALLQTVVRGAVYYAQYVRRGQVWVEIHSAETADLALTPLKIEGEQTVVHRRALEDGLPYLDILVPILEPQSYIRMGFSLNSAVWMAFKEALITIEMSLAIWFGLGLALGGWFLLGSRRLKESPELSEEAPSLDEPVRTLNGLRIDDARKEVTREDGRTIPLSPKEYQLLRLLASEPGRVFSEEEIRQELWPNGQWMTRKDVTHYVYLLRKKLAENEISPELIENIRGHGYKLSI
jgi:hypothetical protein